MENVDRPERRRIAEHDVAARLQDAVHLAEQLHVLLRRQLMMQRVGDNRIHALVRFAGGRCVPLLQIDLDAHALGQHVAVLQQQRREIAAHKLGLGVDGMDGPQG